MKAEDLRKMSSGELTEKLTETRQEVFNLRFRHATAQLENTAGLPQSKRTVARILTILKEREKEA